MKSFVISKRDAGTRVDRFIDKTFENLPKSLMYKEIRKKKIKVNKKRCTNDQKLKEGDLLELYLKDDVLKLKVKHLDFMRASDELDIVYEDENIIILNKKVGVLCHPDGKEYIDNFKQNPLSATAVLTMQIIFVLGWGVFFLYLLCYILHLLFRE